MLVNAGDLYVLKVLTSQIAPEAIRMGLYTNDQVWVEGTVLADLTEVAVSGYARQTTAAWVNPVTLGNGRGSTIANQVVFANTSGAAVVAKGFFYVSATTGAFLGGDNFAAPLTIPATIGTLSIYPELQNNYL